MSAIEKVLDTKRGNGLLNTTILIVKENLKTMKNSSGKNGEIRTFGNEVKYLSSPIFLQFSKVEWLRDNIIIHVHPQKR